MNIEKFGKWARREADRFATAECEMSGQVFPIFAVIFAVMSVLAFWRRSASGEWSFHPSWMQLGILGLAALLWFFGQRAKKQAVLWRRYMNEKYYSKTNDGI